MKIDIAVIRTDDGKYVWADEHEGHGFLQFPKGATVADSWLEKNGLIEPDKKPEPKKSDPKKTAPPANKQVKGPPNDK